MTTTRNFGRELAIAQQAMGPYEMRSMLAQASSFRSGDFAAPLVAAAGSLRSVAEGMMQDGQNADHARSILLLSACAYAMACRFPECGALLAEHGWITAGCSDHEAVALAVIDPARHGQMSARTFAVDGARDFIAQWRAFVLHNEIPAVPLVEQIEALSRTAPNNIETIYLVCSRLAAVHQGAEVPEPPPPRPTP